MGIRVSIQSLSRGYQHALMKTKVPATDSTSPPTYDGADIRHIASIIVALNGTTLQALTDGWYGSPQIINGCFDEYKRVLGEGEAKLVHSIAEVGKARFETDVRTYVDSKNREQIMECLLDRRPSEFYSQLIDIELKIYRAAKAHSAVALQASNLNIPKEYDYCSSYQAYVEYAVANEQEMRASLKQTLKRARRLLSATRIAANDGHLDEKVLETLKLKVLALQEHYSDATAEVFETPYDLFDETREDWW